jgi:hypothetical protein
MLLNQFNEAEGWVLTWNRCLLVRREGMFQQPPSIDRLVRGSLTLRFPHLSKCVLPSSVRTPPRPWLVRF